MKSLQDFKYETDYYKYLRTQFAMAAMQGLVSDKSTEYYSMDKVATLSVQYADALIAALNTPINLTDPITQSKIEQEANNG